MIEDTARPTESAARESFAQRVTRPALPELPGLAVDPASCSPAISRALMCLHEDYASPLLVLDLATKAGISQFYFIRRFRAETGYPPHRYLTLVRMAHAKEMLVKWAYLKVKEVGARVGYNDPAAFSRVFRQRVGMTPKSYREWRLRVEHQGRTAGHRRGQHGGLGL